MTHVADADTFDLLRKDGSTVKIRVHFSDTPEVAHNQFEIDQPGVVKAKAFAEKRLLGELVTVQPCLKSYQRIVCDVVTEDGEDFGLELVMSGHAWLDPRFHPPAKYQAALGGCERPSAACGRDRIHVPCTVCEDPRGSAAAGESKDKAELKTKGSSLVGFRVTVCFCVSVLPREEEPMRQTPDTRRLTTLNHVHHARCDRVSGRHAARGSGDLPLCAVRRGGDGEPSAGPTEITALKELSGRVRAIEIVNEGFRAECRGEFKILKQMIQFLPS